MSPRDAHLVEVGVLKADAAGRTASPEPTHTLPSADHHCPGP
ncbi:hypothetical protein ACIP4W_34405 [Streptomyces sp. NPDC088846]